MNKDITILIVLLWFNIMRSLTCFSIFLSIYNYPYFLYTILLTFLQITLIGEPMHSASKESNIATHPSYINYYLKVKYLLHFFISYVQPVTQQYKSRTVLKALL